ncbi:hypothetical protein SAMN05216566_11453 [Aureimonas phyllosphaerae]|uniref:Uncharacterized protein n=1 Tax=Aureimonas phyllosphaerae TaxID=1166078 RepID=A0A7W6BWL8_9HYPH|nr:hypothetical protein [Aureimonas phyllosphaerae]MBB3961750.1 hypothetical protein [Aureimonas phyllosphaerae]SFF45374.1 hypothetical protein SAMN05216566_11453 [Aureimonas phyllosphaerae]
MKDLTIPQIMLATTGSVLILVGLAILLSLYV